MNDISERLARMEERGIHRDEKIGEVVEIIKVISNKLDDLHDGHMKNIGAMKAHKFWMGSIAAAAGALSGIAVKLLPFTNNLPR